MSGKFQEQVDEAGFKEIKFYYDQSKRRHSSSRRMTICLLVKELSTGLCGDHTRIEIFKGVSVCLPGDQFSKRVGRIKALGKAMQAHQNRKSGLPKFAGIVLSDFHPVPTAKEKAILGIE